MRASSGAGFRFDGCELRILHANTRKLGIELRGIEQEARAIPEAGEVAGFEQPALERFGVLHFVHSGLTHK